MNASRKDQMVGARQVHWQATDSRRRKVVDVPRAERLAGGSEIFDGRGDELGSPLFTARRTRVLHPQVERAGVNPALPRWITLVAGAALMAGCTGEAATNSDPAQATPANYLDNSPGHDWPGPGRTFSEQHYSPLAQVNAKTLPQFGLAWSLDLPVGHSVTQPIAVGGKLYFVTGTGILQSVDAATGKMRWSYDPKVWAHDTEKMRTAWGTRGVAWWNGTVLFGTMDGRLIAVDAATGKERWVVQTTERGDGRYITGAPRVFGGKVIIGHGGADAAPVRGYVTAYDIATGKQLWRFYTVPGNPADGFENEAMRKAAATWHGEWWKHGGGGTVWNAMSYDAETDTVFLGTGNGAPWNHKVRSMGKGDNLYLCSIVALDARTGKYKWHYQTNPGESWDYNAAMDIQLADLTIDGKPRKVLLTAPKNGFFYVIDRLNGALISAEPFVKVTWAKGIDLKTGRPIDVANNRFEKGPFLMAPGALGAHNWLPMAFSPRSGLAYVPAIEMGMTMFDPFKDPREWRRAPFRSVNGAVGADIDTKNNGSSALVAIDPVTQKKVWRVPTPTSVSGGVLATGGGLVFQGTMDNRFSAYDDRTGKRLWSFDTKAPTMGPPISYTVGGRQFVTVITGSGGSLATVGDMFKNRPIGYREQARRVLTFAIGGTSQLPAQTPFVFKPVADPDYVANAQVEQRGYAVFGQTCIMCHGRDASGLGGVAPDLRASPAILSAEAFRAIAKEGALKEQGMPPFGDLSDEMIEDVRQYVRARAQVARTGG